MADALHARTEVHEVEAIIRSGRYRGKASWLRSPLLVFNAIDIDQHSVPVLPALTIGAAPAWPTVAMDDLLDLDWSGSSASKPVAAAAVARPASSQSKPTSRVASPAVYSAFDSLASASSSYAPNYTGTYSSQPSQSSRLDSGPVARTPSPNPAVNATRSQQSSSAARDAFDSLFENGASGSTSRVGKESSMTLQDRMRAQSGSLGL